MRIYDKGQYRDMTPEEMAAAQNAPAPQPTPEERITELEATVEQLTAALEALV